MRNRFHPVIARPSRRSNPETKTGSPLTLRVLAMTLLLFCASLPAAAQVPGDACATAQQYKVNGGPETSGVVHMMVCEGGTWKSIVSSNAAGEVTKIGNQTCANDDYLKYDGTKFICTTAGGAALSGLTAAIANNSINNGNWNQVWNWQLAAGEVGFTFGENTASAGGSADQYILAAKTLATSTATPFMITNLGAAASFRVNDETGDADATPFIISASGNVGIGTSAPDADLSVYGGATQGYSEIMIGNNAIGQTAAYLSTSADTNGYFSIQSVKAEGSLWGDLILNKDGGNVGIGTASPAATLDVAGPGFFNGDGNASEGDIFIGGGGWPYNIGVGWGGGYNELYINAIGTGGGTADFRNLGILNGKSNMIAFYQGSTKRFSVGGDDPTPDAMLEVIKDSTSPLMMLSSAAANNGDLMIVDASGNVGLGTQTPNSSAKLDVRGPIFVDGLNDGSVGDIFIGGGGWPYAIGVGWGNQDVSLRLNPVGTAGGTADFRNLWIYDGKTNQIAQFEGSTKRFATGGNDSTPDAMLEVIKDSTSPLMMLSSAAANNGDLMIVDTNGNVGIGTTSPASKFVVAPPAAEGIAGAATITANACGTLKQINATGNQTTNTTNTFTAPTASYAGCCMTIINVDTADTITLDANTLFKTIGGANQALDPSDAVLVCSNGTNWYQVGAVSGNQ